MGVGVAQAGYHNLHLLAHLTRGPRNGLPQPSARHGGELPGDRQDGQLTYPQNLGVHAGGMPGVRKPGGIKSSPVFVRVYTSVLRCPGGWAWGRDTPQSPGSGPSAVRR